MLNGVLIVANTFISICYFTIGLLLLLPFLRGKLRALLGLATILVFFSCAFGYGGHALLMFSSGEHYAASPLLLMQVGFDLTTAVIAAIYLTLHRSYFLLIESPLLLTHAQDRIAKASIELEQMNTRLESLVNERTIELLEANKQLATEIAERKQAETELKANEERFRLLVEGVKDYAFIMLTPDGHIASWNACCTRIKGYSTEEIIGQHFSRFYRQEDVEQGKPEQILQNAATQGRYEDEGWRVRKDGSLFWAFVVIAALHDESGHLYGFAKVTHDITERKQAEEALQNQTNLLQLILDRMSEAVIVADEQGQFLVFNPAAARIFGDGATDTNSSEWSQHYGLFLPDQVTPFPEEQLPLVRAMNGENTDNIEMFVRHAQAEAGIWIMINGRPLKDTSGLLRGGVIVCRDVTKLKHSEAQLRQQAQELEQTLRELQQTQSQLLQSEKMSSLGQLVAGVAHEINNPVNFIHGNLVHANQYTQDLLELLQLYQSHSAHSNPAIQAKEDDIDLEFLREDLPKLLSSMQIGADRIRDIVRSLRNFSRLDEAEVKAVDIHEGIDSTLMILQYRLKAKPDQPGIQIIKEYGELPAVECYAGQLNQVLMNILTNAIDALEERILDQTRLSQQTETTSHVSVLTPLSPTITIRTSRVSSDRVTIQIADNGWGMSAAVQERLFNPFFTTKPVGKGTGMGMSISYQIITEKHGGLLSCRSVLGKGTEFTIELPLRQLPYS